VSHPVRAVAVVIPAHDEEELLPACLASVREALAHPAVRPYRRSLVVVADACRDATADLAHRAGAQVVLTSGRNVGAARRLGAAVALHHARRAELANPTPAGPTGAGWSGAVGVGDVWLACTDADTVVPVGWVAGQLELAAAGADAVVGTVAVADWGGLPAAVPVEFRRRYRWSGPQHPHVHGANLGVRGSAYRRAGGFPARPVGEDRALLDALLRTGHRVVRTAAGPVTTSARTVARAPAGFAADLRALCHRQPAS
jgi:glycosyltransferase involved in cell wall biosynthesis